MKIRSQLVLVEIILSIALLLAVLFSISVFVRFIEYEELAIETARLKDTTIEARFVILEMTALDEPASYLINEYNLLADRLEETLQAIIAHRQFARFPADIQRQFGVISDSWDLNRRTTDIALVEQLLAFREQTDNPGYRESLSSLNFHLQNDPDAPYTRRQEVSVALRYLESLEDRFLTFGLLVDQVLEGVVASVDQNRNLRFGTALAVPLLILLTVFTGVILFSGRISGKLRKLDKALIDIGGGDFSVRVDIRGRDEFNSLAASVNSFTRTLGAKLESFRLMMHEIGQTLSSEGESSRVEETLVNLAMRDTIADGAALFTVAGEEGQLLMSVSQGRFRPPYPVTDLPDDPAEEDIMAILRSRMIQPGQTVIGEAAVRGESSLIRNVRVEGGLNWVRAENDPLFLASVIVIPLRIASTVIGVLVTTSSRPGRLFSDLEYANLQSFGELAAITLDNIYKYADLLEATQLNRELGIAEEIQQDLLPKRLPLLSTAEVAYMSRSVKGLNGDYFDVYPLGDGRTMLTICEVAGRGVPAGLVMVMIRTILRLVASPELDARDIITLLNQDMTQRIAIENYASVGILLINNDGNFSFSSAAHYPLQILRSGAESYEQIQTGGMPVGIDKNAEYQQVDGVLAPDDLVLFHTDGVPEARDRDGEMFGMERLLETVRNQAQSQTEEIIEDLRRELEFFERNTAQKDDQTVIILKYTGGSAA